MNFRDPNPGGYHYSAERVQARLEAYDQYFEDEDDFPPSLRFLARPPRALNGASGVDSPPPSPGGPVERLDAGARADVDRPVASCGREPGGPASAPQASPPEEQS